MAHLLQVMLMNLVLLVILVLLLLYPVQMVLWLNLMLHNQAIQLNCRKVTIL